MFATCARGLELILAAELRLLNARDIVPGRGGVHFRGDLALLYRANLWLRTAVRVLWQLLEAPAASPEELYDAVQSIDWQLYLTPDHTLAVDCNVRDSNITHSQYAARKVKDAICDQFIQKCGRRPSVDTEEPMVKINLHIHQNLATLSLDSSGDSLHKRGYRPIQSKAPLNEALAAGLILLTGWKGNLPLVDPLCGSGTLCIEAAWIATRRPPGLTRKRFGFQGWMNYDVAVWTKLRDQARGSVQKQLPQPIIGSDLRKDAIQFAQTNARAAGIGHLSRFEVKNLADFTPPLGPPGVLICNPPYGERLGETKDLYKLYQKLGEVFRERCAGWRLFVFTGNAALARRIGMKPKNRTQLFNGRIPCQFLEFESHAR
ncbi:MAG: THUMP domain-containing protein [Gemmataceae bacterium]|nr:THUMP domain-containing protein [Gemmataceae bacterium]MCI0738826.1 THUMP domain-containing protein [Gemmataceae bacterium]